MPVYRAQDMQATPDIKNPNVKMVQFGGELMKVGIVTYKTGEGPPAHYHPNDEQFVYVLEGNVEMQVAGGELQRLGPGGTFYENPDDIHTVSRNSSDTEPARILVVFIKMKGAPLTEYVED